MGTANVEEQMSKRPQDFGGKQTQMCRCDLCGTLRQMGPNRFHGEVITHYQMQICHRCLDGHSRGIPHGLEARFVAHLQKHGIALPGRNDSGLYPMQPTK